jgi:hypothetical protein
VRAILPGRIAAPSAVARYLPVGRDRGESQGRYPGRHARQRAHDQAFRRPSAEELAWTFGGAPSVSRIEARMACACGRKARPAFAKSAPMGCTDAAPLHARSRVRHLPHCATVRTPRSGSTGGKHGQHSSHRDTSSLFGHPSGDLVLDHSARGAARDPRLAPEVGLCWRKSFATERRARASASSGIRSPGAAPR